MSGIRRRLRAVVDSNLFVSATLLKRGNPDALRRAWRASAFELLLSENQYNELLDVLNRPRIIQRYRLPAGDLDELFAGFASATRVDLSATVPVHVRDPDDIPILAAAIGGAADDLVTGNGDLLEHRDDPRLGNLQIVTVVEFLAVLDQRAPGSDADR